ncbi:unnamed protein product [Orchesella dallaii]|uniref:Uncharacterized protein n=1 Tax=Orchesella dallaii TaxID=48710 RepID=A0ABP1R647_9HEXA
MGDRGVNRNDDHHAKKDPDAKERESSGKEASHVTTEKEKNHARKGAEKKLDATKGVGYTAQDVNKPATISKAPGHGLYGDGKSGGTTKATHYGVRYGARRPDDVKKAAHVPKYKNSQPRNANRAGMAKKEIDVGTNTGGASLPKGVDPKTSTVGNIAKELNKGLDNRPENSGAGTTQETDTEDKELETREAASDSHLDIKFEEIWDQEDQSTTSLKVIEESAESISDLPQDEARGDTSCENSQDNKGGIHAFSSEEIVILLNDVQEQVMETIPLPINHEEAMRKVKLELMKKLMLEGDEKPDDFVVLYKNSDPMWPSKEELKKQEKIEKLKFREDGCLLGRCLHQ